MLYCLLLPRPFRIILKFYEMFSELRKNIYKIYNVEIGEHVMPRIVYTIIYLHCVN